MDRFKFYDHTKIYTAAPPDVLRVDEKHLREHYVFNVLGFIITTNHKTDGIYLPADDRRHYVAWSDATKEDFTPGGLTTPSPPAEKATARQDQAGQSGTHDGGRNLQRRSAIGHPSRARP